LRIAFLTIALNAGAERTIGASGSGSVLRMAAIVSAAVSPLNGARPASISYISTPRLQRSLRASTSRPRACSGDM
jgi:hypothetical protein